MNRFENFVQSYKDILALKKPHITSKKTVLDVAILTTIMVLISTFVGYITKSYQNLSYVVNVLNTIILGSFIIYKVINEIRNKQQNDIEYSTFIAIFGDVYNLIFIILSVSLAQQLLFYRVATTSFTIITYSVLLSVMLLIYGKLNWSLFKETDDFKWYDNLGFIIQVIVLSFIISTLLPIEDLILNVSITYLITILLLFYKSIILQEIDVSNEISTVQFFVWMIFIISMIYVRTIDPAFNLLEINKSVESRMKADYKLSFPIGPTDVFSSDDEVVMWFEDRVDIYSHSFKLIKTLDGEFFSVGMFDGDVYLQKKNVDIRDEMNHSTNDIYIIEKNELKFLMNYSYPNALYTIPFNDKFIVDVRLGKPIYLNMDNVIEEVEPIITGSGLQLIEEYDNFLLVVDDDYNAVITNTWSSDIHNQYNCFRYAGGYCAMVDNGNLIIEPIDTFFSNTTMDNRNIVLTDIRGISSIEKMGEEFVVKYEKEYDGYGYFVSVLDSSLNVKSTLKIEKPISLKVTDDYMFFCHYKQLLVTSSLTNNTYQISNSYSTVAVSLLAIFGVAIYITSHAYPECLGGKYDEV